MVFSGRVVLAGVSLSLADGDHCALIGRSGSGKTSLLLVLAGLLRPEAGTVDRRVAPASMVYVPQAPSLIPELTVLQNATIGLRIRRMAPRLASGQAREQLRALGAPTSMTLYPRSSRHRRRGYRAVSPLGGPGRRVATARSVGTQSE